VNVSQLVKTGTMAAEKAVTHEKGSKKDVTATVRGAMQPAEKTSKVPGKGVVVAGTKRTRSNNNGMAVCGRNLG